jgi:hypothetical protein
VNFVRSDISLTLLRFGELAAIFFVLVVQDIHPAGFDGCFDSP